MFGRLYLESLVSRWAPAGTSVWPDLIATLAAVTARNVAGAIQRWVLSRGVDEVIVSGGGARNPVLLAMLGEALGEAQVGRCCGTGPDGVSQPGGRSSLSRLPVLTGEALGIDPDAKEALAFAALAWAYACGIPGNVPEATGARGPRLLGSYTPGPSVPAAPPWAQTYKPPLQG
jgi:anhydro-N-acetylmuramic acid kinase